MKKTTSGVDVASAENLTSYTAECGHQSAALEAALADRGVFDSPLSDLSGLDLSPSLVPSASKTSVSGGGSEEEAQQLTSDPNTPTVADSRQESTVIHRRQQCASDEATGSAVQQRGSYRDGAGRKGEIATSAEEEGTAKDNAVSATTKSTKCRYNCLVNNTTKEHQQR